MVYSFLSVLGERDVVRDPRRESRAYESADSVGEPAQATQFAMVSMSFSRLGPTGCTLRIVTPESR